MSVFSIKYTILAVSFKIRCNMMLRLGRQWWFHFEEFPRFLNLLSVRPTISFALWNRAGILTQAVMKEVPRPSCPWQGAGLCFLVAHHKQQPFPLGCLTFNRWANFNEKLFSWIFTARSCERVYNNDMPAKTADSAKWGKSVFDF